MTKRSIGARSTSNRQASKGGAQHPKGYAMGSFSGLKRQDGPLAKRSVSLGDKVRAAVSAAGRGHRRTTTMMPIGVPRVPYKTPNENSWQWVDIWNCLYRERIVWVGQVIDEELGNQLVATMLYLDSIDKSGKDIYLYINTEGGDIVPTMAGGRTYNSHIAVIAISNSHCKSQSPSTNRNRLPLLLTAAQLDSTRHPAFGDVNGHS